MNPFGNVPKRQNSAQADTGTSSNPFANIPLVRPEPGDFDTGQSMLPDEPGLLGRLGRGLNQAFTNQDRAQARAMNEYAARRVAEDEGISVARAFADGNFKRPGFNPEGRSAPQSLVQAGDIVAKHTLLDPKNLGRAIAKETLMAVQGNWAHPERTLMDRAIDAVAPPKIEVEDPNYEGLYGLRDSLAGSIPSLAGAGLAGAGTTAATGNPLLGAVAAGGTSGVAVYRGSKNRFMREAFDYVNQQLEASGEPTINQREWSEQYAPEFEKYATKSALWEAGPVTAANLFFINRFRAPLTGNTVRDKVSDAAGRVLQTQASEQTQELATATGQNRVRYEAGREQFGEGMDDRIKTPDEILREQALLVALQTGGMQAGAGATSAVYNNLPGADKRRLGEAMLDTADNIGYINEQTLDAISTASLDPRGQQVNAPDVAPMVMPDNIDVDFNQNQTRQQPSANPFSDVPLQYSRESSDIGAIPQQTETGLPTPTPTPTVSTIGASRVENRQPEEAQQPQQPEAQQPQQPVEAQQTPVREPQTEPVQPFRFSEDDRDNAGLTAIWEKVDKPDDVQAFLKQADTLGSFESPGFLRVSQAIMPDVITGERNILRHRQIHALIKGDDPAALQAAQQAYDAFRGVETQPRVVPQNAPRVQTQQAAQTQTPTTTTHRSSDEQVYATAAKYVSDARRSLPEDRVIITVEDAQQTLRSRMGDTFSDANPEYVNRVAEVMVQAAAQGPFMRTDLPLPPSSRKRSGSSTPLQQNQPSSTPKAADSTSRFEDLYKQSRQGRALDRIDFDRNVRAVADLVEKAGGNHRMVRKHLTDDYARPDFIKSAFDEIRNTLGDNEAFSDLLDRMGAPVPVQQKARRTKDAEDQSVQDLLNDTEADVDTTSDSEVLQDAEVTDFNEVSKTLRQSIYETLWHEIGLDPVDARALPPQEQYAKVVRALRDKYGFTEITRDKKMPIRMALDSMLDAYRNLHFMAHSLGLPLNAMSMNGKLTLSLEADGKPYLGAFTPSQQKLSMPGRSNSFAHEWGHAFDYHMLERLTAEEFSGLSGLIRKKGIADFNPENAEQAFVSLMNALFFDQAAQAAEIHKLEVAIENAKTIPAKEKLQKKLDAILDGNSQTRSTKSNYHRTSGEMGNSPSQKAYWRKPTEMLARAFEAYVALKVSQLHGGANEFITKGNDAYLSMAEERLAKSFPKDHERDAIFLAFDNLFDAVREDALLGPDAAPAPSPDLGVVDPVRYADYGATPAQQQTGNWLKRAYVKHIRDVVDEMRRDRERKEFRPKNPKDLVERTGDKASMFLFGVKGQLRMYEDRYNRKKNPEAAKVIREFKDLLVRAPGEGRKTNDYESDVEIRISRFGMTYDRIQRKHDFNKWSNDDLLNLREALIGTPGITDPKVKAAASDLRRLMDDIWYYAKNNGIKIGYVENSGYLPRQIDRAKMQADTPGFVRQAKKVYDVVFRDDTGIDLSRDNPFDGDINFDSFFSEYMKHTYPDRKKTNSDEVKALWQAYDAWSKADPDARDAETQTLVDLMRENQSLIEDVRNQNSEFSANAWYTRQEIGDSFGMTVRGPDADFRKERTLPKEADTLLRDFYNTDPMDSVVGYMTSVVRRTEYARRFGDDNAKLSEYKKKMLDAGVHGDDIKNIEKIANLITGRQQSVLPNGFHEVASATHFLGTIVLLTNATWSSIVEPITISFHTGDIRDSGKAMAGVIGWATRLKGKERREALRALAEYSGVVQTSAARSIMLSRVGGTYASDVRYGKGLDNFFRNVLLTQMTEVQRMVSAEIGMKYFGKLLQEAYSNSRNRDFARRELAEYKIGDADLKRFSDWYDKNVRNNPDGIPSLEAMNSPEGDLMSRALQVFADYTVQNPQVSDRPYLATSPYGRLVYGIMSFAYAYYNNVTRRSYERIKRNPGLRTKLFGHYTIAVASLVIGQAVIRAIRDAIYNPSKYEDDDEDEKLRKQLWAGVEMSNLFGPVVSTASSMYTGLRYERDLTTITAGPAPGFFLQSAQRALQSGVRNSENTNTAEFRSLQGLYAMTVGPALGVGLSMIPGGTAVGIGAGAAVSYGQSRAAQEAFAEALVGERGTRKDGKDSNSNNWGKSSGNWGTGGSNWGK